MRLLIILILSTFYINNNFGQKVEKVVIPNGISYNYCDTELLEQAITKINNNLTDSLDYSLSQKILIIGP